MYRQDVQSSNIRSVGYDTKSQLLEVEFNGGEIYEYYLVPSDTYEGLMEADSKGRYHHRQIRDKFEYKRVR